MLVEFLRADHIALNAECAQLPLQRKTKAARFIDRMHFPGLVLNFGRPVQEGLLPKSLRRLGISSAQLLDHRVKILVHINAKCAHRTHPSYGGLDCSSATIKLAAGSLV